MENKKVLRGGDVESVETECEMLRDILNEGTNEVCGVRRVRLVKYCGMVLR